MCKPNQSTKTLTKKDFYNAFYNSNIKDSQTRETLKDLIFNEGMDIAAEVAYNLYRLTTQINEGLLISLSDRQDEFKNALARGFVSDFDVFAGWEKDEFFVVNQTNKSEYKVFLTAINGESYASCECGDFLYRQRLCKHISQVLLNTMFGYRDVQKTKEVRV